MSEPTQEVLTDEMLNLIADAMEQFAEVLLGMAQYAEQKSSEHALHPGQELYWGGFIDGIQTAAGIARETRPLRGIK